MEYSGMMRISKAWDKANGGNQYEKWLEYHKAKNPNCGAKMVRVKFKDIDGKRIILDPPKKETPVKEVRNGKR